MKKMVLIALVISSTCQTGSLLANQCAGMLGNLSFYEAFINKDHQMTCYYRYCYYGCMTDSYTIGGHVKPYTARGAWQANSDGGYSCSSTHPGNCEFNYLNSQSMK